MGSEVLPPAPSDSRMSQEQERLWGMLAHLLSFAAAYVALGFLAPLGVLIAMGEKSPFVRAHAVESLNFQLTTVVWVAAAIAFGVLTLGIGMLVILPLGGAYLLFYLIVVIIAGLKANHGETYRYPATIRFIK